MKNYVLLVIVLALKLQSFAQANFVPGVVMDKNGQNLTGEIDFRDWVRSPKSISFKNANGQIQIFDAAGIAGFYILSKKETYISRTVEIDMTPDDPDKVLSASIVTPMIAKGSIFMLELVKNPLISLYEHTDSSNKSHFYYIKQNDEPVELIHHYLYVEADVRLVHDTKYQQQIGELISSCPGLSGKTRNLKYREREIQDLIVQYLNCTEPASSIEVKTKDHLPVNFGIIAGFMFNSYRMVNDIGWAEKGYKTNISPIAGIAVDFGLSPNSKKLHFLTELIYKRYKTSNSFAGTNPNGFGYQTSLKFDFSYIQLNTLLRYVFVVPSRIKPFFEGGLQNAFVISEKENSDYTKTAFGSEVYDVAIVGPRKYEISFPVGAGLSFNKISLDFRYSFSPKSFSSLRSLDVRIQSLHFLVTYKF